MERNTKIFGRRSARALVSLLVLWGAISVAGLGVGPATAASPPAIDSDALHRSIASVVAGSSGSFPELGVMVTDLEAGRTVYTHRPDTPRILASNTKLLTSAAALDTLGPGYTFDTWLLARGRATERALVGDLAVIGGGDPNISERMNGDPYMVFRRWAAIVARKGIRVVTGDLYLVHGFFEDAQVHPDWPRDQLSRWYEAPVSALSFNDNCVHVRVWPTRGAQARVDILPRLGVLDLQNRTRVGGSQRSHQVVLVREPGSQVLEARGYVWRGAQPVDAWVTVEDPVTYFGAALVDAFAQEGIEIQGALRPVRWLPRSAQGGEWSRWARHQTDMMTTLEVVNHRSQNFYAESVLKTLGAEVCDEGTWAGGLRVVSQFLDRVGIPASAYEQADGSGMSRNNRFTPRHIVEVLQYMDVHRWRHAFLESLPRNGFEGSTLEKRLVEGRYRGKVRAKTGTLNGVSTLSGYVEGRSGRRYAFSVLANQTQAWRARQLQDRILQAIIDNG